MTQRLWLQGLAMRVGLTDDAVRWARCLAEFMKHTGQLCEVATRYAYIDICARIQVRSLRASDPLDVLRISWYCLKASSAMA